MSSETITALPIGIPALTDILYAVQGYNPPSNMGISVQETLQSISELLQSNIVLTRAGNPNGFVAGYQYQLCWDSLNRILYVCSTSGTALSAVWSKSILLTAGLGISIAQNGNDIEISADLPETISWNDITTTSSLMVTNNAYQANNAMRVALTLPTVSSFGDDLWISGYGAGGWNIVQAANQQIIVGNQHTTLGVSGSLASTNENDSIQLYCVVANLIWKNISGPQGNLTFV